MRKTRTTARREWLLAIVLGAVVVWAYLPVVTADYIWDDDAYVVDNANLLDWHGLTRIWTAPETSPQYYPLVFTSFWLERQAFGPSAGAHHAVNIALHIANALLLWVVLRRLRVRAAYVIALVFAVHPVHLESVAWITERKNVLSGLFYLGALLAYLAFAFGGQRQDSGFRNQDAGIRGRYLLSLLLFLCALLCKTVTSTLPVALWIILWWKRDRVTLRDAMLLMPFLATGLLFGAATAWMEVHHVGALGNEWTLGPLERVLLAGRVVWFYALKLVWPHPLMFVYPRWHISAADLAQYAYPLAALGVAGALWRLRKRIGKEPLVAVLFFAASLFPAMGFFNVYPMRFSYVADHFQYLASIGLIGLVVGLGHALFERIGLERLRAPLAAALVLALAVTARGGTGKYQGVEALWEDTIAKNPDAWIAQNNLGNLRLQQGRFQEARARFQEVLRVKPDLAVANNNLGTACYGEGDIEEAVRSHERAVRLDPRYAEAWNNLGVALAGAGRYAEAIARYTSALRVDPRYAMAHYNLANALVRSGDLASADVQYGEAIRLRPDLAMAHYSLGLNLLTEGKPEEAAPFLQAAFRLKPDFAVGYYQAGNVYLQQRRLEEAVRNYTAAIRAKPDYPEAYCNRGTAWLQLGRLEQAIADYQAALRLRPDYAIAAGNLDRAQKLADRGGRQMR